MNKEILDYAVTKTKDLIAAPMCCSEAKEAAQAWMEALGTENEAEQTKNYIAELEEDIIPIDHLIAFAESDAGTKAFGEQAKNVAAHAKEIKTAGAIYCDCPACTAAAAILEKKDTLLK